MGETVEGEVSVLDGEVAGRDLRGEILERVEVVGEAFEKDGEGAWADFRIGEGNGVWVHGYIGRGVASSGLFPDAAGAVAVE